MSNELALKIKELIKTKSYREIGRELGYSRTWIYLVCKKEGFKKKRLKKYGKVVICKKCKTSFLVKYKDRTLCSNCRKGK